MVRRICEVFDVITTKGEKKLTAVNLHKTMTMLKPLLVSFISFFSLDAQIDLY